MGCTEDENKNLKTFIEDSLGVAFDQIGEGETLDLLREILEERCAILFGCGHTLDDCLCDILEE